VVSVAFSPDGKTLASGSGDRAIILWDVASRQPLDPPLTGHTDYVSSVAFSPDGQTLAAGGYDTLILWDVSFNSWKDRACRIANRNFTRAEWQQYIRDIEPYRATCFGLPVETETKSEGQVGKR
jgi:WD40 repeat protein